MAKTGGFPELRDELTTARREHKVHQVDVADELKIDDSTMSRYLNGRRVPPEGPEKFIKRVRSAIKKLSSNGAAA